MGALLKVYLFYLPKEELKPEPAAPRKSVNLQPTISGLLTPKKLRSVTFPEAPPISSITSSTRLGSMIGNTPSWIRAGFSHQVTQSRESKTRGFSSTCGSTGTRKYLQVLRILNTNKVVNFKCKYMWNKIISRHGVTL